MATLSSSNGMGALVYDATQYKITEFLEHPYQASNASTQSRNFAYDSYPGIRIGTTGTWLNTVAPSLVEYLPGTGIIHVQRSLQGLMIDEYDFAPMALAENASVMLVEVTQNGSAGPIDVYSLFNYHVGTGSPSPGTDNEDITYDATRDAYYDSGPSGIAMAVASLVPSSYHGSTPNNPFDLLTEGSYLADDPGTGGPTTDAVLGFQSSLGVLTPGQSAWSGWVSALAPDANGQNAIETAQTWLAGRTPAKVLSDEQAAWDAWRKPSPAGASTLESALDQQAQAILRPASGTSPGYATWRIQRSRSSRVVTIPRRRRRSRSRWPPVSAATNRTWAEPTGAQACPIRSPCAATTEMAASGATPTRMARTSSSTASASSSGPSTST
jgi:hypothetical protein